jgi:hypothetical protein
MKERWYRFVTIVLGVWLLMGIVTFGCSSAQMCCSDGICGALLILLGWLSLSKRFETTAWLVCIIGLWLEFAPLIFWAPSAYAYVNDTLVGILAIAFSILVPGTPGDEIADGPTIPAGWRYNPSSWVQRAPTIALAAACWFMSRYLAAFQLGYIDSVWDPFFENGTFQVITSKISRSLPVSDAGLGALAYSIEALMGCKGNMRRWYSMPWIVVGFGILVVPLGLISVLLIILQPVAVGNWCSLCLLTAMCMLVMITFTIDEVAAVLQFLYKQKKSGRPIWTIFWKGARPTDATLMDKNSAPLKAMARGISIPWNLVFTTAAGVWLMFAPSVFSSAKSAADSDHIMGAFMVVLSVVSMAEVVRAARYIIIVLGVWLIFGSWLLVGAVAGAMWNDLAIGILAILLALPKGRIKESYGSWQRLIF